MVSNRAEKAVGIVSHFERFIGPLALFLSALLVSYQVPPREARAAPSGSLSYRQAQALESEKLRENVSDAIAKENETLEKKLVVYIVAAVASLEEQGVKFEDVDEAFMRRALVDESSGLGRDTQEKVGKHGFVGIVSVFLSVEILTSPVGIDHSGIWAKAKLDWSGGQDPCNYEVYFISGNNDFLGSKTFPCSTFSAIGSTKAITDLVGAAIAKMLGDVQEYKENSP